MNLNKIPISLLTLKAYHHYDDSGLDKRLDSMTHQLKGSFDAIRHLTQIDLASRRDDDDFDDGEDDDDLDALQDDTDEESDFGVGFYLNLIVSLSPSMAQVYSQAIKNEEDAISMDAGDEPMSHIARPLQLSNAADREKPWLQSYSASPPNLANTAVYKSFQNRFSWVMQKRSKNLDKKLWPKIPVPPIEASGIRFQARLHALSEIPLRYESSAVLDEALSVIPLNRIYHEAKDENLKQTEALRLDLGERPRLGYKDCVIRALLRYIVAHSSNCIS